MAAGDRSRTTEAGKEGGNFFGRGAVLVNDAEKAALQEIATALKSWIKTALAFLSTTTPRQ